MAGTLTRENLLDRLEVRITQEQLQTRIREMAGEINKAYQSCEKLIVIGVLKGSFLFMADLIRHLDVPCHVEFVRLASYGDAKTSSGTVKAMDLSLPELTGEHVLIVEDIVDTGLTLQFFKDYLESLHKTESLRLAVLLDKPATRQTNITIDYAGFQVENEFLVGYGLDFAGYYRNLPYIGVVTDAD
ncbi:MAG: hypoxanthine phosphoribosyltransferase [Vampirovibrionales bacterium]|nr:hypoxanthine phosphoribosyltransferase [Vampirovibrionales bacterium]